VERVLDEVAAPVHLVGHSYGGLLALTIARRDPGRVRSIAVYDPVAFRVLYDPPDAAGLADAARVEPLLNAEVGGSAAWFEQFIDYWSGPGAWRALHEGARASFLAVGRKVFLEVRSLLGDRTPASAYAGITAPALLLTGEHTPIAARRVVALLAAALPNATPVDVQGAGHMGPITHADVVNERIVRQIVGNSSASSTSSGTANV
jgi:pimeloyl-ACP methyl ester carboxylesterase